MGIWVRLLVGLTVLVPAGAAGQSGPLREARSANGRFELRLEPGRAGVDARGCRAALHGRGGRRPIWERVLVNDVAPERACVRDDGGYVVTLDEYRRGGARNALVIYGARGELLRHFLLIDLLGPEDWKHVRTGRRELVWLDGAKCEFAGQGDEFVVTLKWGRAVRIDLKTLRVRRGEGEAGGDAQAAVPPEVLALVCGQGSAEQDGVIGGRLEELAALTPEERARTEAIAGQLVEEGASPAAGGLLLPPGPGEPGPAGAVPSGEVEGRRAGEAPAAGAPAAGAPPVLEVPPPDPVNKYDYVSWLNGMMQVEGADAAPLYEAAISAHVPWEGDGELLSRAMEGDPAALAAPEVQAWLAANEAAVAAFREASRYPARSFSYDSPDGTMVGVLLPSLSHLRGLTRASIIEGRRLAAAGQGMAAADCYLDTLAAGGHTGGGMSIIENLVGVAMQSLGVDALLDLQAGPQAADLDYVALADAIEDAAVAPRAPSAGIEGERAMYLDAVQRLWSVDPGTGQMQLDTEAARSLLGASGDAEELERTIARLSESSYEEAVATGNAYYDALAAAMARPFAEGQAQIEALERRLEEDPSGYPLHEFLPSLGHWFFLRTRNEADRRAAVLVTRLNAHRQKYGEYPDSLAVFGDAAFTRDPFGTGTFVYRREGAGFRLYSLARNGADDAGVHDRRGDTNDIVYWPRPE